MDIAIDTLELTRELRQGGVDEKPAETIARAIQRAAHAAEADAHNRAVDIRGTLAEIKAILPTLATKVDIAATKADIAELRAGQKFIWWGIGALIALVLALIGIILSA